PPTAPLFPYTTRFRSREVQAPQVEGAVAGVREHLARQLGGPVDRRLRLLQARAGGALGREPVEGQVHPAQDDLQQVVEVVGDPRSEEHTSELQSRVDL